MSRITVCDAPPRHSSGRKSRLTDEEFQDLADGLRKNEWVTDNEEAPTKSAAYQRAQSVVKKLSKEPYKLINLVTGAIPTDGNPDRDERKPWYWRVGPLADGETPRRGRRSKKADVDKKTDGASQ